MKDKTKERIITAVSAACLAVIYVSTVFLLDIVEGKSGNTAAMLFGGAMVVLYLLTLISEMRKTVLAKWLLSIPFAIPIWYWFVRCDFALRALNWVYPGYGRRSAGGAFASVFMWINFTGLCFAALLLCLIFKRKLSPRVKRAQVIISVVTSIALAVIVNLLIADFPTVAEIMS